MRIFYIYNVNDFFSSIYENSPYKLYKLFEDVYLTNKHDMMLSSNYYDQMIVHFNKLFINQYILANHKLDVYYYHKNNNHLISSQKEYTKLSVSSYCLKLKTNLNYPDIFQTIKNYSDNIFVCDFQNQDYFWLKKIAKLEKIPS